MSNTSSDLILSLPECTSSCCNRSNKQNGDSSKENYKEVKSQSLSEDRSEHYARLLKESEQALANRNVLISLLQEQLVKMEELYKKTLEKHTGNNMHHNKNVMRRNDEGHKLNKTEDKSLVKLFENPSAQQNTKLDTIFETSNKLEELKTSRSAELSTSVADSSDLSLVESMRSLNVIKSVRSKIETEFLQECQVNFEEEKKTNRLHRPGDPSPKHDDEMQGFFEQARKDEGVLERALRSQRCMIEDLQRNMAAMANDERTKNLFDKQQGDLQEEQSLPYESPRRRKRTMMESELRMLNERLFQKEYVINAQHKKMRRLEDKLENTYQELIKHVIKNKSHDPQEKEIIRLEEALKNSELKIEEERRQYEETIGGLQSKLAAKENAELCKANALNEKLDLLEKFKDSESLHSLAIEEVKSQVTLAIKRQQDVDLLQTKIVQMASELENANKQITKCVDQNRTLLEDYEAKFEHVQKQYLSAKEENDTLKDARANLEAALHQKDAHIKQLQREVEKAKEITDDNLSKSQAELVQKDSLVTELRENLNAAVVNANNLKEAFESKLAGKDERIEILDRNFKQMAEELDNTNKERAQFIQEVQKLFCEYDVKLAVIKGECENAQKKILQLKQNEGALNLQITAAQAETEKLKRECETLTLQKQSVEEELTRCKEGGAPLEEQVKLLRATVAHQKDQLDASNKSTNEAKKLEFNLRIKMALLLKEMEVAEGEREAYVEKNRKLFCKYENEMRQLNDDCENMGVQIQRLLKKEKEGFNRGELGELRARVVRLEQDKADLRNQVINCEEQLEEYERKMKEMTPADKKDDKASSSSSIKTCGFSIPAIKEESVLEAYEELATEKEILEGQLKEMEEALEDERRSKIQIESELLRFREKEKAVNENLRRILPEFLGQGDDQNERVRTGENPAETALDLQNKVAWLSRELEQAKAEKWELIKRGKQIFYHYETNIIKLKSDCERVQNEMLLRNHEGRRLDTAKEEAQHLKESQEAYSKRLTSCLKELAIYKDEVKNWMEAYDKVIGEKLDLETETKILVNNVLHKDEAIKEMQDRLGGAEEKLASLTKESAEQEKIISDYQTRYNRLSCEYEEAQNVLGQLKQSKEEMNKKITMKDKLIRRYEEQVDAERDENARLNEDIAIWKTKLSTLEEEIEEKEKDFYVQLDETKSALFEVTQNYEKLEIEYGYLSERQDDLNFYKMENASLLREIEERDENIKILKGDIEELEKELCNVRTEMDLNNASASLNWEELQSACAELEKKLELTKYALKKQECQAMIKADDDFKDLQRQIEALKETLGRKDEENLRLSERLERAQKEKTELNLHMAETIRELEREIAEIKSSNRLLREQITDRSQQLLQQKQHETSKENECETLKQQLKEANSQKSNLDAAAKKLESKCASLKSKNDKLQGDISKLEKELVMNKSWKTENAQLQVKLDNIESELFGVKQQCSEVHDQLKTTKIKLAETQEELSLTKRELEGASAGGGAEEAKTESQSFFSSSKITETMRDGDDGRSICVKVNLEKRNFQESDTIKLNKHITVLYNNTKFSESRCETESSTISNIMLARGSKIQERLASLNQMEKEVENMISAVQEQNKKLRDCHLARVKNEKDIDTRLQKVRQRRDTLATNFDTFQAEIGHRIDHAISIRKQFENT